MAFQLVLKQEYQQSGQVIADLPAHYYKYVVQLLGSGCYSTQYPAALNV